MNETYAPSRPPAWFWVVAVLAVLWEAVGCTAYVMQVAMGPAELSQLPPAQADAFARMPSWLWAVFAVAVWSGLAGAIGLLLRRGWALTLLWLSLFAAAVQYGYTFLATPILETMPVATAMALPVAILVIGAGLVWFAGFAKGRGWLA